jgi:ABC-type nitrate/sulfonate/bicarbonate transport system substrate-binding protein
VQEWLRQNGADTSTIKIFEMPFSPMTPALTRGTLGAAFIAEPFLSERERSCSESARRSDVPSRWG